MRVRRLTSGHLSGIAIAMSCALLASACSSSAKATAKPTPATADKAAGAAEPAVATCSRPHQPGLSSQSFTYQRRRRTYLLYVPTSYRGTARVPLVLNFHGYGSNASQQMALANFGPIA